MRYCIEDTRYAFKYFFDTNNGSYLRTGILDGNGIDTGVDPFMGSFPHLIDVGVMGHCVHGKRGLCTRAGIDCYQSGLFVEQPNMTVEHFQWICEQCSGKCNQLALGGRGDPDQHEYFEELLRISRVNKLVPNFTTSGYGLSPEISRICRNYCGAVAVSWYRSLYTLNAIQMLLDAGVRTNIHYVLGKNSIDEAIERLETNDFPEGVNAVIFLLYKPVGQGTVDKVLDIQDPRIRRFFALIETKHPFKVGMDSCTVPGAFNMCSNILFESLDTCEGARFSCYIGADMVMVPCSFDQTRRFAVPLFDSDGSAMNTIEQAWNSVAFDRFRDKMRNACPDCDHRRLCLGGCPLTPNIVFCDSKKRVIHE